VRPTHDREREAERAHGEKTCGFRHGRHRPSLAFVEGVRTWWRRPPTGEAMWRSVPATPHGALAASRHASITHSSLQFVEAVLADVVAGDSAESTASSFSIPSDVGVSSCDIWAAARGVLADALAHNVSDAKLTAALTKAGVPADARDVLGDVLSRSRARAVATHATSLPSLLSGGGRVLVDWAWEVRHVVSSSSLAATRSTLVRITFTTRSSPSSLTSPASHGPLSTHVVEVTEAELAGLIATLEAAAGARS